jgi:serine/threonine protein kinase
MDKYHIYEEIGKGEFSQVYKGREKKKIEYVAIKRIEKSAMSKVGFLNEIHAITLYVDLLLFVIADCERGSNYSQTKQRTYAQVS